MGYGGDIASGAATGAGVGAAFGGVGAVPGAVIGGLAGLVKSFLKHKGEKSAAQEQRKAQIAALMLQFNQGEDRRLGQVANAEQLLGSIGQADAYGGRVNPNMALDPTFAATLKTRRETPDFSQVVPDATKGSTYAYLSGLAGDIGDTAAYLGSNPGGDNTAQGLGGPKSGSAATSANAALSLDDLMGLIHGGGSL